MRLVTDNRPLSPPPPQLPSDGRTADIRVAGLMEQVIQEKNRLVQTSSNKRFNATEAIQIGGDLFNMGYLAFQGAQILKPSLSSIGAIAITSLACGVIGGAINIGEAFVCLKEGMQAHKNGDLKLAARLYIDFIGLFGIGIIMMLTSLAARLGALSGLSAVFAAHPWLLPVLFLGISIPVMIEVSSRLKNIWNRTDFASQLKKDQMATLIHGSDANNPYHLQPLLDPSIDESSVKEGLSNRMEALQANMGVEAAIETFKLMQKTLRNEDTDDQFNLVQKKITEWNRAQYIRFFQQALYVAAFLVSMASLHPKLNTRGVEAGQSFAMAAGNGIPLYIDTFWPFKRNTPIVVPKVDLT